MPVDGGPCAELALDLARDLAGRCGADLTVAHVVVDPQDVILAPYALDPEWLRAQGRVAGEAILQRAAERVGTSPHTLLIDAGGQPAWRAIVRAAAQVGADLIVMGTHGRTGVGKHLMGSVAGAVVRHAEVPVLLQRLAPQAAGARPQPEEVPRAGA